MQAAILEMTHDAPSQTAAPVTNGPLTPTVHLAGVDALRGLAAFIVLIYHHFAVATSPELRVGGVNVLRLLNDGWCAVNLFLVLSGFCLFWPFARDSSRSMRYGEFMRRRCFRILPAYYAALILVPIMYTGVAYLKLCTPHAGAPQNTADILVHIAMLHSFTPRYFGSWNGVSWSLGLEWTWYLAFPLALWLFRRFGPHKALLALCACAVSYRVGLFVVLGPAANYPTSLDYTFTLRTFLLGRLIEFGLGMYVASWLARGPIPRRALIVCASLILPVFFLAHLAERFDVFLPIRDALYGLTFALLLVIMVSFPNLMQSWRVGRFLRSIGEYSYSLYLFHMPFVHFALGVFSRRLHATPVESFFGSLLFTPVTLFACRYAYRCFEAPFLNLRAPGRQNMLRNQVPANA